jgi:hypothetical protein
LKLHFPPTVIEAELERIADRETLEKVGRRWRGRRPQPTCLDPFGELGCGRAVASAVAAALLTAAAAAGRVGVEGVELNSHRPIVLAYLEDGSGIARRVKPLLVHLHLDRETLD